MLFRHRIGIELRNESKKPYLFAQKKTDRQEALFDFLVWFPFFPLCAILYFTSFN